MRPLSLQTRKRLRDSPVTVHMEDETYLCLTWLMGKDFQEVAGK